MQRCTRMLEGALTGDWLATGTIVPIPPSKTVDHPEYDDRMSAICRGIRHEGHGVDVRDLIRQRQSTEAAHLRVRPISQAAQPMRRNSIMTEAA
jgi:hypothetical protein